MSVYNVLQDFAVPALVVVGSGFVSWLVARYSARRGAELGVQAAADLEREKQKSAIRSQHIESLQHTLFALSMQINDLSVWWRHAAPFLSDEHPWLSLPAFEGIIKKDIRISIEHLSFMVRSRGIGSFFSLTFLFAENQYELVQASINDRSRLHRQQLQPKIAAIIATRSPRMWQKASASF